MIDDDGFQQDSEDNEEQCQNSRLMLTGKKKTILVNFLNFILV